MLDYAALNALAAVVRGGSFERPARAVNVTPSAGSQRLNLITSELQEAALRTRMQPIGNVFHKFGRVVRDISVAVGKEVRLELETRGEEHCVGRTSSARWSRRRR